MKLILTGATGYVGEGVLRSIIDRPEVDKILSLSRRPCGIVHSKLEEYIVPDFMQLQPGDERLQGYDAVLFCAGMTGGFPKDRFRFICHDIPLHLAEILKNRWQMTFIFVSGEGAGKVKRHTENRLSQMGFKGAYGYRVNIMKPLPEQRNKPQTIRFSKFAYRIARPLGMGNTMRNVGLSMLACVRDGFPKMLVRVRDIDRLVEKIQ